MSDKKPIQEVVETLRILKSDIKEIKSQVNFIKRMIHKYELQEKLERERIEKECVVENKSWWYG